MKVVPECRRSRANNIVDCLEFDLTRCDSADDWPPNPRQEGRDLRREHARSLSDSVSHHNRFAVLDPPVFADDPTSSDTESAMEVDDVPVVHRRQRLRLIWNSQARPQPPGSAPGCQDSIVSGQRVSQKSGVCSQWGATAQGNPPTTMFAIERPVLCKIG